MGFIIIMLAKIVTVSEIGMITVNLDLSQPVKENNGATLC